MRILRVVAAVLIAAGAALSVSPVRAASSTTVDDVGWWAQSNVDGSLGVPAAPDVAAGQLLVEGTPAGATAIAAVRATLPAGSTDPVLGLRVASPVGADRAVLLACQAGSGWTGAHGGPWAAKPSPDCAASVQGQPSEDGSVWTFPVGALQFGDQLNLVLVPGLDPDEGGSGIGSTFRIVFEGPTASDFTVTEGTVTSVDPDQGSSFDPPPVYSPPTASGPGVSSFPSFVPPPVNPAAVAALPLSEQGQTATAPVLTAETPLPVPEPISDRADGRLFGFVIVVVGAGLAWWTTRQPVPVLNGLSRFSSSEPPLIELVAPRVGGLGRFRRERTDPARRLGT